MSGVIGLLKMHNDFQVSNIIFRRIANYDVFRPDQQPHHRNLEKSDEKSQNERKLQ